MNDDNKSIIVYGENEDSLDSSYIKDFAPFTDLRSMQSIEKDTGFEDRLLEDSFTRILEVDEEYLGSN